MSQMHKFSQYLPVPLTSLNVPISETRNVLNVTSSWYGIVTYAWHNDLILTTANNANSWADVANHVFRLWQAVDTENFGRRIAG